MSADADTRTDLPVIPVTDDDIRRMAEPQHHHQGPTGGPESPHRAALVRHRRPRH